MQGKAGHQARRRGACARAGVLILSEFAGAAQSLGAGAILVNPWNITDMAAAIEDALTMSDQARLIPTPCCCLPVRHPQVVLVVRHVQRASACCAGYADGQHLERVALLTHHGAKGRIWS